MNRRSTRRLPQRAEQGAPGDLDVGAAVVHADRLFQRGSELPPGPGIVAVNLRGIGAPWTDPVDVARRWAPRINHVHCKDVRPDVLADARNRNLSFLDAALNGVFTVPGDGCVDYPAVFAVLKEAGYEGWLVVEAEQDMTIAHPLTYASMGYNNLSSFAREAALI